MSSSSAQLTNCSIHHYVICLSCLAVIFNRLCLTLAQCKIRCVKGLSTAACRYQPIATITNLNDHSATHMNGFKPTLAPAWLLQLRLSRICSRSHSHMNECRVELRGNQVRKLKLHAVLRNAMDAAKTVELWLWLRLWRRCCSGHI